jgi:hypothetical protein
MFNSFIPWENSPVSSVRLTPLIKIAHPIDKERFSFDSSYCLQRCPRSKKMTTRIQAAIGGFGSETNFGKRCIICFLVSPGKIVCLWQACVRLPQAQIAPR